MTTTCPPSGDHLPWHADPYARALRAGRGPLYLRRADGGLLPLDVERWCARADKDDMAVLDRCAGSVLDIGCGTGRVLDLGIVAPERYAGVDSSQAMLNLLLRKHPKAAAVYPADIRNSLRAGTFTPGQFDWVVVDASVQLTRAERQQVEQIARLAVIDVDGGDWVVEDVSEASVQRIRALRDAS